MSPTLESIITLVGTILGSTFLMRIFEIILYRREEQRARSAAASKGEAEADLTKLQAVGVQHGYYDALFDRYVADIARCSERLKEMEANRDAERKEREARTLEREKEGAELRLRLYNMELILVDLVYGVRSLSEQMQEAGITPRWKPIIKPDRMLEDLQHEVPDIWRQKK